MQDRVVRAARDVQALGPASVLRAAYEVSKRGGGHRAVFGRLARTAGPAMPVRQWPVPPRDELPEAALQRLFADADAIVDGTVRVFGRDVPVGESPDWHLSLDTGRRWPQLPWWDIDIRTERRVGDVKWTWELARHRHLVVLARAVYAGSGDGPYLSRLEQQLRGWLAQNPLETGVNWYSNLELALRAIAWAQILALAGEALSAPTRAEMTRHLHHIGRHLVVDYPYTLSSMRNNHLLGDSLGLIVLGHLFDGDEAARWGRWGRRWFDYQLRRHVRADGSMIEDSLSYQRFVLDMLAVRNVIDPADAPTRSALVRVGQMLCRLGALDGNVPQFGDWDEGRVLATSGDARDVGGAVRLALARAGGGALPEWRAGSDECCWYAGEGRPVPPDPPMSHGADVGGGLARVERGHWQVWLKAGDATSHRHADLTQVVVAREGVWVVGDPGTGTYNGDLGERNGFRSSGAHDVLRVQALDQLVPHRVFRWQNRARGWIGEPVDADTFTLMCAVHNAYARLDPPRQVLRVVVVEAGRVTVQDVVEGADVPWSMTLPLGPGVEPTRSADGSWRLAGAACDLLLEGGAEARDVCATDDPFAGWWSETYGDKQPAHWLEVSAGGGSGLVAWSLLAAPTSGDAAGAGEPVVSVGVEWRPHEVALDVAAGARTWHRTISTGEPR